VVSYVCTAKLGRCESLRVEWIGHIPFLSFFLSFLVLIFLHSHCSCSGLLLHLIRINDTHTPHTHTHTHSHTYTHTTHHTHTHTTHTHTRTHTHTHHTHTHTPTHTHSRQDYSGPGIGPSQRPLPDNTQHSQQTDSHASGGIRTRNPRRRMSWHYTLERVATEIGPCLIFVIEEEIF